MTRSRRSSAAILSAVLLLTALAAPVSAAPQPLAEPEPAPTAALSTGQVRITQVDDGFVNPLGVVNAGDGTGRLFVLEQRGTVRVVVSNARQSGFFLDLRGVSGGLTTGGERGLLGLAFHPDFKTNRRLVVNYTNGNGDTVIAEFTANAGRTAVPLTSRRVLQTIAQPFPNHNGGQVAFGPDGWLYVFMGDGGGAGDPQNNAQNDATPLGKVLRMNPDSGAYTHWAKGLRNPWRASFDSNTLWIADVGQASWEEVNRVSATGGGGFNFGWRCREGTATYNTSGCPTGGFTNPIATYARADGNCSVTGGHVYRGGVFRELAGHYVLGDFCSGRIWTLEAGAGSPSLRLHRSTSAMISSFGVAENRELYMTDWANGILYRVVAPPFSDVTDSRFINDITWLFYEDITRGCGSGRYCPKSRVARDQMASFLARALDLPPTPIDYFDDDNGNKHEDAINRLAAAGITVGCGPRLYCPSATVLREQMATFIARALKLPPTSTDYYTDDNDSKHEAGINRMAEAGITRGCTATKFCPKDPTTREQMAAFLRRAFGN
jgi:glucose/arabinose dehydrogenase